MYPPAIRDRPGFTITELLVVITIAAALLVLSLSAINKARESVRRNACSLNQSRLGVAMARYNSRNGILPGWRHSVDVAGAARWTGFIVPLLPFLDKPDVYAAYTSNMSVNTVEIAAVQCPTIGSTFGYNPAQSDYGANFGTGYGTDWLTGDSITPGNSGCNGTPARPCTPNKNDGALADNWRNQFSSLDDISAGDGLASTILIAERSRYPWYSAGNCFSNLVYQSQNSGCGVFGLTVSNRFPVALTAAGYQMINGSMQFSPRSSHGEGAFVTFSDGATRFLRNELAPHAYGHLVTSRSMWGGSNYFTNTRHANVVFLMLPTSPPHPHQVAPAEYQ